MIFYLLFFQSMNINYRRSLCAAARNLDCDRELEDESMGVDQLVDTPDATARRDYESAKK